METCFVASPFGSPFDKYYQRIVRPAIVANNLDAVSASEMLAAGAIMDQVWESIARCRLLVAELTGRNPNVFYELGLAHAIEKPAILLVQDPADVPFDVSGLRAIAYDTVDPDWATRLRTDIEAAIGDLLRSPPLHRPYWKRYQTMFDQALAIAPPLRLRVTAQAFEATWSDLSETQRRLFASIFNAPGSYAMHLSQRLNIGRGELMYRCEALQWQGLIEVQQLTDVAFVVPLSVRDVASGVVGSASA